ncbi:hypothetical protein BSKO_13262 [Bryopsis sp. KO-2023]|nr:hypothetical protein BSKO_13262 [Bryopsis sp. KO-2023]
MRGTQNRAGFVLLVGLLVSHHPIETHAQGGDLLRGALGFATNLVADRARERAREGIRDFFGGGGGEPEQAPPPDEVYDVRAEGYVPTEDAGTRSKLGGREIWSSLTSTFVGGVRDLARLRPACSTGSIGIVTGCSDQFAVLVQEYGYPLFYPRVSPEKYTQEFYDKVPVPDWESQCCRSARLFQGAQCACDVETIMAMRDLGLFDPEMTVPFADFLYGDLCGANTFLATDCPNGSPFEKLRGKKK